MASRIQQVAAVVGLIGLVLPRACEAGGKTGKLGNGTKITKGHRGSWTAPGGPNCRWVKTQFNKDGVSYVVAEGGGDRKQMLFIYSSDKGGRFTTANCGTWK